MGELTRVKHKSKTQEQIQLNSTQLREMKEQQNETTAK